MKVFCETICPEEACTKRVQSMGGGWQLKWILPWHRRLHWSTLRWCYHWTWPRRKSSPSANGAFSSQKPSSFLWQFFFFAFSFWWTATAWAVCLRHCTLWSAWVSIATERMEALTGWTQVYAERYLECSCLAGQEASEHPVNFDKSNFYHHCEKEAERWTLSCPAAITTYNRHMAGVDKGDQLRHYYSCAWKAENIINTYLCFY